MPKEKARTKASAGFFINDPRVEVRLSSSADQIDLSIYSASNFDTCMAVTLDEPQANELVDKLWIFIHELNSRKDDPAWKRLRNREN